MPTSGNACARKGRSETWQFAKNKFWSDFVRKQIFRESRQVLLRKRMRRGFEFVLILQTTRGSNFGLLATEVYLTSFIILVFSTCVRSIRESLGETTPAGFFKLSILSRQERVQDKEGGRERNQPEYRSERADSSQSRKNKRHSLLGHD
ncbi:hypothetical protein AVEN_121210-1 [Araneus ventricosus]|uniref:Uncharacterized protein n=1 Tax=Araneus ventricosus TaxID=182803 RepID=A0A4Y1ZUV3_ARAVE|nr:hypothetical protein AVEN_129398-1 [Araneus ventricosus]GBM86425.1 hypothetical protein AVEN_137343-1 [Araneus ventricosus]GBM86477.1 hypothetical protein AVEN_59609-1 [Araneus ventricosus]GBM86495.1 hypothetical protein AVEN_121210-1 [Araneus ventricosus]